MLGLGERARDGEILFAREAKKAAHRVVLARETLRDERRAAARIHGGDSLHPIVQHGDEPDVFRHRLGDDLREQFRGHVGQIDGEDEQPVVLRVAQCGIEPGERAGVGCGVGDDGESARGIRAVGAARDEYFRRAGGVQFRELALPEQLAVEDERGFVRAHAAGVAPGEEHGGKRMWDFHGARIYVAIRTARNRFRATMNPTIRIQHLYLSPGHNFVGHHGQPPGTHAMLAVPELRCLAGRGIEGDRFLDFKPDYKGQITFFAQEIYTSLCARLRVFDKPPSVFRRNVITVGVDLNTLIGQIFEIQGVRFLGTVECSPCHWQDGAFAPGAEESLHNNGGLRAKILCDGVLRVSA